MNLKISSRYQGDVLVLSCAGRLVNGPEAQQLHDHVKKALSDTADVVVHLGGIVFIDSTGMGTLVRLLSNARQHGGDLKLCNVPEFVSKVLKLTNLHTVFDTYATEAEAVSATYNRRKQAAGKSGSPEILCVEDSQDLLAYLMELLRGAGYRVLSSQSIYDAQMLLKATRPALIVLGPNVPCVSDADPQKVLRGVAPEVPQLKLAPHFAQSEAGDAGSNLLQIVQAQLRSI